MGVVEDMEAGDMAEVAETVIKVSLTIGVVIRRFSSLSLCHRCDQINGRLALNFLASK
jgi:hypothetical protein